MRASARRIALLAGGWLAAALLAMGPAPAQTSEALSARLERSVGQTLDAVELSSGRRIVRPVLAGVSRQRGSGMSLRLLTDPAAPPQTVQLATVSRIIVDREVVYESGPSGGVARQGSSRSRDRGGKVAAESAARMRALGIDPWPSRSAEEHAAEVLALEGLVEQVRGAFPGMRVATTHEFIFVTDIPEAEVAGVVASLDQMHDVLCDLYDIPAGEPVWFGKCLVLAFRAQEDFLAFERRFVGVDVTGAHGICHQAPTGRVIVAGHKGPDQVAFEHMLVHETSHGFNHRWVSPVRLPNWLNEGIAEWIGMQVVPAGRVVPVKEAQSLAFMRTSGHVGEGFFTAEHIGREQYGIASGLVRFMAGRDRRRFKQFVRGIKEGQTVDASLDDAFQLSLDQLLSSYGATLSVPGLTRATANAPRR